MPKFNWFIWALSLTTVFWSYSCTDMNDNEMGDLNIRFKLKYGDQPFEMFKEYEYPVTKDTFLMSRLSFFISDISLVSGNVNTKIKDIDYLNLTASHTAPVAVEGLQYVVKGVKTGQYNSLDFGIGVPKNLNALAPKDFPSENILSSSAEYWSSWKSYIFFRPEGLISLGGKPLGETSFALHLGGDDAFRKISLTRNFEIVQGKETSIDVYIDIEKFFNGKSLYDISQTQQIHSLSQMPLISQLADNLVTAIR